MKNLILIALLAFAGSFAHAQNVDTVEGTNAMIDKVLSANGFNHIIMLHHSPVFFQIHTAHASDENAWWCYVTYAVDLGYGYSRGPFRLRIMLSKFRNEWVTQLDVIAL